MADSDVPIALRRTPRRTAASVRFQASSKTSTKGQSSSRTAPPKTSDSAVATTPRRKTTRKRVRFSDPGPVIGNGATQVEDEVSTSWTGLTPMMSRTRLATGTPKRRHSSAPVYSTANTSYESEEITFLPLRQVLDGRVKRRIRRNGLSEEMNTIFAERKTKAKQTKEEMNRLRQELEEKDEAIMRLQEETVMVDTDRVWELERKVSRLRRQLSQMSGATSSPSRPSTAASSSPPQQDWTDAARDPFSKDAYSMDLGMDDDLPDNDTDEEIFGDSTMAELACSTPTRKPNATVHHTSASFRSSFPTPPSTSPARQFNTTDDPLTPCSSKPRTTTTTTTTTTTSIAIQTSLPDPAIPHLQTKLSTLQRDLDIFKNQLTSHLSLPTGTAPSDILSSLSQTLTSLSDKTHALTTLNKSLSSLGFAPSSTPNPDALDIITAISSTLRSCRLELEYLSPGELALPLSGSGGQVLKMMVQKLQELDKRSKDAGEVIEELRERERGLKGELSARVDFTDHLQERLAKEQNDKKELEAKVEELREAVDKYTNGISKLETLISDLEERLERESIEQQLHVTVLERGYKDQLAEVKTRYEEELNRREEAILGWRVEIERVRGELRETGELVGRLKGEVARVGGENDALKAENAVIAQKYEAEKKRGKRIVGELGRVLALARGEESEDEEVVPSAGMEKGTKKRRYDGRMGFTNEAEAEEVEAVGVV
ncbi:Putative protein of unknown function [Podospora comata]|uniref:Uncharacterized protein n=1 Tax=Podospora comata TaxID=48703 RepID=A0ABY6SGK6_PODCO|nr:Putative protein of unknown function [Podospora comata]